MDINQQPAVPVSVRNVSEIGEGVPASLSLSDYLRSLATIETRDSKPTAIDPSNPHEIAQAVIKNSTMSLEPGTVIGSWGTTIINIQPGNEVRITDETNDFALPDGLNFITASTTDNTDPIYNIDTTTADKDVVLTVLGLFEEATGNPLSGVLEVLQNTTEKHTKINLIARGNDGKFYIYEDYVSEQTGVTLELFAGLAVENMGFEIDKN